MLTASATLKRSEKPAWQFDASNIQEAPFFIIQAIAADPTVFDARNGTVRLKLRTAPVVGQEVVVKHGDWLVFHRGDSAGAMRNVRDLPAEDVVQVISDEEFRDRYFVVPRFSRRSLPTVSFRRLATLAELVEAIDSGLEVTGEWREPRSSTVIGRVSTPPRVVGLLSDASTVVLRVETGFGEILTYFNGDAVHNWTALIREDYATDPNRNSVG